MRSNNSFGRLFAGLLLFAGVVLADGPNSTFQPIYTKSTESDLRQRDAVAQQSLESFFPQLIVGGEWTTTIKLLNRGSSPIPATSLYFKDNLGALTPVTFQVTSTNLAGQFVKGPVITASAASFSIAPGFSIEATFLGTAEVKFGHIFVGCNSGGCSIPGLYGEVILRNRNPTRPDFESVFPLERPATLQYMAWDHRDGLTSVLYLVSPLRASVVTLEFRNAADQLLRATTIPLGSGESQILTLHALAPETVGQMGTLVIRSGTDFVVATALRINPSNSFTPVRAFIPNTAVAVVTPAPVVSGVTPTSGTTAGGTSVTISGINFIDSTGVSIGGSAVPFTVVNSTTITATTAPHAAGAASVTVTTPGGTSASNSLYTFTAASGSGFGSGTYRIGVNIAPGRYYTVPASGCYWERLSGLGGTLDEIIANDFLGSGYKQAIVDIAASDLAFSTDSDCGTWFSTPRLGFQSTIPAGTWLVGTQLAAGTYQATVSSGCYWERLRNFGGSLSAIIANDFVSGAGTQLVLIATGDVGFTTTSNCGVWTRISAALVTDAAASVATISGQSPTKIEQRWRVNRSKDNRLVVTPGPVNQ